MLLTKTTFSPQVGACNLRVIACNLDQLHGLLVFCFWWPRGARESPGKPGKAQGGPGRPGEAQGGPGRPGKTQGGPGRPGEAQGGPGRPREAREGQGGPGRPGKAQGVEVFYCHQPRAKTKDPPYGNSQFLKTRFCQPFCPGLGRQYSQTTWSGHKGRKPSASPSPGAFMDA